MTTATVSREAHISIELKPPTWSIVTSGNAAHSATSSPSAQPLRKVTKATAAGLTSGSKLPAQATRAARARLAMMNRASISTALSRYLWLSLKGSSARNRARFTAVANWR